MPAVDIPPLSLFFPSLVGSTREVEGNHTTSPKAIKTQMFSLYKQEADEQGLLLHPLSSLLHGYFLCYVFIYLFILQNIYAARSVTSALLLFLTNSRASQVHRKHPGFAHEPVVFGTESTTAHWEVGTEMTYQVISLYLKPGKKLLGWFELTQPQQQKAKDHHQRKGDFPRKILKLFSLKMFHFNS